MNPFDHAAIRARVAAETRANFRADLAFGILIAAPITLAALAAIALLA